MTTKLILMGPIVALLAGALPGEAHAGSCESGTKVASDIWREHDATVKTLGCAVVTVASEGAVPPNVCLDAADKVAKVTEDMIKYWNVAAGNSWAKIGPRRLDPGEWKQGQLVSTGGRMWITALPVEKNQVEVSLKKLDGKAETVMTVCKEYRGKYTKLWEVRVENGKENEGDVWKRTFSGVKGHNIVVHLDAKSVANKFKYQLKLDKG